jgi:hypothetical protein
MGVGKQIDKQHLDRRRIMADLVIAGRFRPAQFQPVERRFAGQRRAIGAPRCELAAITAITGSGRNRSWSLSCDG